MRCRLSVIMLLAFAPAWVANGQSSSANRGGLADSDPENGSVVSRSGVGGQNRAVAAILELPRSEPSHAVRAIVSLIELGEPAAAEAILSELIDLSLSQAELAALVQQVGSRAMLVISQEPSLQPAGGTFANQAMEAASSMARDTSVLDSYIAKLGSGDPQEERLASVRLQEGGSFAAAYLIETLHQKPATKQRAALQRSLLQMGDAAVPLLVPLLDSGEPHLVADAVSILASSNRADIAPLLLAPALLGAGSTPMLASRGYQRLTGYPPTSTEATRSLQSALERALAGTPPSPPDADQRVTLWRWNREQRRLESERFPEHESAIIWASIIARDLATVARATPGVADADAAETVSLALSSESVMLHNGYGSQPKDRQLTPATQQLFQRSSPRQWSEAIAYCLKEKLWGGAALAAEKLGQLQDTSVLYDSSPKAAPLLRALQAPNAHTRFAAISACIHLDPGTSYPGKSYLPRALAACAENDQAPLALVAMPTLSKATRVAGMLQGITLLSEDAALQAEGFNQGRALLLRATRSPNCAVVMVDLEVLRPGIREVLYQLRSSPQSGGAPIAVLAPPEKLLQAERIAQAHDRVQAFPRPDSQESIREIVKSLSRDVSRFHLPDDLRRKQAEQAQAWLTEMRRPGERL